MEEMRKHEPRAHNTPHNTYLPVAEPGEQGALARFGRYLEEFEVGAVYKHGVGRTITADMDRQFCEQTSNFHPLHIDANFAAETRFGKNVVVGNLVFEILFGGSVPEVSGRAIANLEITQIIFWNPTFHDDTIYGETEVLEVKPSSDPAKRQGVVTVETRGFAQTGEPRCSFRRKILIPMRPVSTQVS